MGSFLTPLIFTTEEYYLCILVYLLANQSKKAMDYSGYLAVRARESGRYESFVGRVMLMPLSPSARSGLLEASQFDPFPHRALGLGQEYRV